MNLPIATKLPNKPIVFAFKEDRLNTFISTIDLDNNLKVLAGIVEDFLMNIPIAAFFIDWPPVHVVLKGMRRDSPLYKLYETMEANLSMSGYPITVISTMAVVHHEPFETTLIEANSGTRLASLH